MLCRESMRRSACLLAWQLIAVQRACQSPHATLVVSAAVIVSAGGSRGDGFSL